jgi:acyl phosphate:glycerol-3-phosphate acyltransferase
MTRLIEVLVIGILSFVIGSIPFGYVIGKIFASKDVRKLGSGNIGATNVMRTAGVTLGIVTLILDVLKGFLTVIIVKNLSCFFEMNQKIDKDFLIFTAGLLVFLGHIYSLFLKFKGGKGVAVGLGVFLAINIYSTLIAVVIFLIVVISTRFVSLGSILGTITVIVSNYLLGSKPMILFLSIIIGIFVIYRHKTNIQKLFEGTENKIFNKYKGG